MRRFDRSLIIKKAHASSTRKTAGSEFGRQNPLGGGYRVVLANLGGGVGTVYAGWHLRSIERRAQKFDSSPGHFCPGFLWAAVLNAGSAQQFAALFWEHVHFLHELRIAYMKKARGCYFARRKSGTTFAGRSSGVHCCAGADAFTDRGGSRCIPAGASASVSGRLWSRRATSAALTLM